MKTFLKRFWPWKRIDELEVKAHRLLAEVSTLRKSHAQELQDERVAHEETKQHLKAAREAREATQGHIQRVLDYVAMKHGIK